MNDNDKIRIYDLIERILENDVTEYDVLTILAKKYLSDEEYDFFMSWRDGELD